MTMGSCYRPVLCRNASRLVGGGPQTVYRTHVDHSARPASAGWHGADQPERNPEHDGEDVVDGLRLEFFKRCDMLDACVVHENVDTKRLLAAVAYLCSGDASFVTGHVRYANRSMAL